MCGIAGIIDLTGRRNLPRGALRAMADAIIHRGPDEDGYMERPGLGLASRRLSIIGLADGQQPVHNENRTISVVYNGELFDYPECRTELEKQGHQFSTHCDTELIPHLYEEHEEEMLEKLRGQFALALWDQPRQRLILARDRFGICPLYWARRRHGDGEWLLFASEIKALLASGMVEARPDPRGISHLFTFFAVPGPVTSFEGVQLLQPGQFLRVQLNPPGQRATVTQRIYWEMDFPDKGDEDRGRNDKDVVDGFEEVLLRATRRRLRADVPVVSYLSGGVDSSIVVAMASKLRGSPIPTFTIGIEDPKLNEESQAMVVARHIGSVPTIAKVGPDQVLETYPKLIQAAEAPVIDTSCAALMLLAKEVHRQGYKVAITGEGSDEWLAGYPWFKVHRLLGMLDIIPGLRISEAARSLYLRISRTPRFPWSRRKLIQDSVGGPNAWLDIYGLMALSKFQFFSPGMWERLGDHLPYNDLPLNLERAKKWHPLNRSLYLGGKIQLPGLLLNAKGDRVAMHSSVETRYPFLDEDVFDYLAKLHPSWKFRGLKDKYILRLVSERWLPKEIAWRRKAMFRAPFDSFFAEHVPAFVDQLLSDESIKKSGFFDAVAVQAARRSFRQLRDGSARRTTLEMGLVGVISTQLWYHTYIDGSLADLPSLSLPAQVTIPSSVAS